MKKTFQKHERLKSKRYFDALFAKGKSIKSYPIRVIFLEFNEENFEGIKSLPNQSQVAFSVPKKRFKKAVDRNRIKRQMREAYRLNKHLLNKNYAMVFVYLPNEKLAYQTIEKAMVKALEKLD